MSDTTSSMRKILFSQMRKLQKGTICIREARETNRTAKQINNALRLDIENKRENIKVMKATKAKRLADIAPKSLKI